MLRSTEGVEQAVFKEMLSKLSPRRLFLLDLLLADLAKHGLLNQENVEAIVVMVTYKMAKAEEKWVEKEERENTWMSWLLWCTFKRSKNPGIFTENGKYLFHIDREGEYAHSYSGGCAKVKVGRKYEDDFYAIKKFNYRSLHSVKHETRYASLLGYNSYFFIRKNRTYAVSDWCNGDALHTYDELTLIEKPLELRLQALLHCLQQLQIFHSKLKVHGDIKPENCVYHIAKNRLSLIDFSGAHNVASRKTYTFTPCYSDDHADSMHRLAGDMFCMGSVMQALFPELKFTGMVETPLLLGVRKLLAAMVESEPKYRCSCCSAIEFCQKLLGTNDLNQASLEAIEASTLDHSEMRLDDVLSMSHRPMKFANG